MNTRPTALICGGAASVFEDIEAAKKLFQPSAIFAINNILADIPDVDHFISMHPMKMPGWLKKRRENGFLVDPKDYWTAKDKTPPKGFEFKTIPNTRGGSGMLAVFVARYLGYKSVLAGIPMTVVGAHYHNTRPWAECLHYRIVWERNESIRHDVRSMSGWTREWLGFPDEEWLAI